MSISLSRWEPFKELKEMEERFNKLFPKASELESSLVDFTPSVNSREGDYAYHVEVDLPGVKKKDIKVEVKDNRLFISGERKEKKEVKKDDYQRIESSYGKFERSFILPGGIDSENVKASCEDGVLEVTLPKLEKIKTGKQVKVT
ncbi:Hsp20/alpha crystallin family protein [Thiomicrorhabdus sp.]|uniref:Hsp20/alpha crystallin family protein n=1 Tax=Thiomicrorhabdus sp. TaxID=2039724 RepID=UPI002AA73380|nr:Hsp20/alpha crystallin family protein [Thiomicrorhabdus sp.]